MRYARNPEVLWRLVGERIALRHAADRSDSGAAEAAGAAALLWLCLDEPATADELKADLAAALPDLDAPLDDALALLLERDLIAPLEP
ncbi:MAG: hypothetical protein ACSLFP_14540 [Acidimicrobiales bacterium]